MTIPFVDLTRQYKSIQPTVDAAIKRVLSTGQFIGGPECESFEKDFATYLGAKYTLGVNSGTDALILGTRALGLSSGDEILIPVNTFYATVLAATQNGLKPVFVDIDPADHGISLEDLKRKITSRTKAIAIVHLYGQSDKISEILEIIKKSRRPIHLIEDACQAHGAFYKSNRVGTLGTFGTFSFYPAKNLGAYGDGGAIVTNDSKLAKAIRLGREYGQTKKYHHEALGINSRLDPLQAAILRVKLTHLDSWNTLRQHNAALYTNMLSTIPQVHTPPWFEDRPSVYHLYVVRVKRRAALQSYLHKSGIHTQIHYPIPLHRQKAFSYLNYKPQDFPHAEKIASEILSLPLYPELPKSHIKTVTQAITHFYSS